jgi:hypothetical protein
LFFIKPVYFEELLHHYLISFAEFILENFELTSIDRQDGVFHVHIDEKNAGGNDPERRIQGFHSDNYCAGFSDFGLQSLSSNQPSQVATTIMRIYLNASDTAARPGLRSRRHDNQLRLPYIQKRSAV